MQAVILAAGMGNRLDGIAGGWPKCYLPIGGQPLIRRNIALLKEKGVEEVIVVTGYQRTRVMDDLAGPGVAFAFNPFFRTTNTLVSMWLGLHAIRAECVCLNADVVFDPEILAGLLAAEGDIVLACDGKRCGEEEVKFCTRDGQLCALNKTIPPDEAEGEFTGLWKMSGRGVASVREAAARLLEREEYHAYFEAAIEELLETAGLALRIYDLGSLPWCEIDFPHDYQEAKRLFE